MELLPIIAAISTLVSIFSKVGQKLASQVIIIDTDTCHYVFLDQFFYNLIRKRG